MVLTGSDWLLNQIYDSKAEPRLLFNNLKNHDEVIESWNIYNSMIHTGGKKYIIARFRIVFRTYIRLNSSVMVIIYRCGSSID